MEKYSLLTKLAKCTLNIALKLTFSVFLFFFVFWLHFRPPRHCLRPFLERQFFTRMTVERREEKLLFSSLLFSLVSLGYLWREKEEDKERNSCLGWNQVGTKLQIRLPLYVYVLSRWYVFSIFNLFHWQYDKVLGLSFRDTWHSHYSWITPFTLDRRLILPIYPHECSFSHSDKLSESKGFIQAHYALFWERLVNTSQAL